MAPKSENLAGLLDMAGLLDLLNSSEGRDEDTDATQPEASIQQALSNVAEPSPAPAPPDTISSPTDLKNTAENRFAAHIVHGMSKLRQS
jgi:hypothetical protein